MENVISSLIVLYLIFSLVSALFKRAAQEPPRGEFGEAVPTSPYEPQTSSEPMPSPAPPLDPPAIPTTSSSALEEEWEQQIQSVHDFDPASRTPGITLRESAETNESDGSDTPPLQPTAGRQRAQRATLRELLSRPEGVRSGILLAEILGPPKALRRPGLPYSRERR